MPEKISVDEYMSKRKHFVHDGKVFKSVVNEKGYDAERRSARFVMTTETSDLVGDVIKQDGIKLDNFLKNPISLAFHDHTAPIGNWKDVQVVTSGRPKRTEGTLELHKQGTTAATDEIANLLAVSGLKAVSIGFLPEEVDFIRNADGAWTGGFLIPDSILLECSVVSVPCNPQALLKGAGGDMRLTAETLEFIADTYCEEKAGGLFLRKDFTDLLTEIRGNRKTVTTPDQTISTLKVELDLDEAERQAEGFVEKWSKRIADMFKAPEPEIEEKAEPVVEEPVEPEPPALVSGSRQKAVVASARIKQSLRERGLLT